MTGDVVVDQIIIYLNMFANYGTWATMIWMLYEIRKIGRNNRADEFLVAMQNLANVQRISQGLDGSREEGTITRE